MSFRKGFIEKSEKSKKLAFWLCMIFGPLGLHRFYVGRITSGLCMLVPSLICFSWASKKFNQVFGALDTLKTSSLAGADQAQQLNNLYSALGSLNTQSAPVASSNWDGLMSWVSFGLLMWALMDLIVIVAGQFRDRDGRTL